MNKNLPSIELKIQTFYDSNTKMKKSPIHKRCCHPFKLDCTMQEKRQLSFVNNQLCHPISSVFIANIRGRGHVSAVLQLAKRRPHLRHTQYGQIAKNA